MRNLYDYPKILLVVTLLLLGFSSAFSQNLDLKLQLINDTTWGVFVKPVGITPTSSTITGSAQVTIVSPKDYDSLNIISVKGTWNANAYVNGPSENTTRQYISIGLQNDFPKIPYIADQETLLFTFERTGDCPDSLYIIDCGSLGGDPNADPFCPDSTANSANSNPGNEFSVIDFGNNNLYGYGKRYALSAWSCKDCDGDGILNAFEDTNGNGVFDAGDASAVCDPCDPIHVESATMSFGADDGYICAGDVNLDTAYLIVEIIGGWTPYTVKYTDDGGTTTHTVPDFRSGDSIMVIPNASTVYSLVTVIDSFGCEINPDSLSAPIQLQVEGPISFTKMPRDTTVCYGMPAFFDIKAENDGVGVISYQWQVKVGANWVNIINGTPYSTATTDTLHISNVAGLHDKYYRAVISTPHCDPIYSDSARLSVEGPVVINPNGNPSNLTVCDGAEATFTASGVNSGAVGDLHYLWQIDTGSGWVDLTESGAYSGVASGTITINPAVVSMDGHKFRMKLFTGACWDTVFTAAATLDIEGPITFVAQPQSTSNCAGSEVFFTSEFSNPGGGVTNVQWQIANDQNGPWTNISNNNPVYTGIIGTHVGTGGSDTLTITNVLGLDGKWYRVVYTTPKCTQGYNSSPAQLTVSGNVIISDDPDDITVCSGTGTSFSATASIAEGTFVWRWEISLDNGITWDTITIPDPNFDYSSSGNVNTGNTTTLTIGDVAGLYDARFRAVASSTHCNDVISKEARLSVEGPLTVATQPYGDTLLCSGEATQFTSVITNPGVAGSTVLRWQKKKTDGSWGDINNTAPYNGTSTEVLSISNSVGLNGSCYRLSAKTSTCATIYTNEICLTVEGPITVATQPQSVALCSGEGTSFTSTATLAEGGTLSYQWEVSSNGGTNWANVSNGGVYSGATLTTLSISNVANLYNHCYRLRFKTTECNNVWSEVACLTVEGPIDIEDQPIDVTQCSGEPVLFIVGATNDLLGGTIQYQWEESSNNGSSWTVLNNLYPYNGTKTDTLSISNTVALDSNLYRVKIWTTECAVIISNSARLTIEGPVSFLTEPLSVTECSGNSVNFSATTANPGTGAVQYQWEEILKDSSTWKNISSGGIYSGTNTASLTITPIDTLLNGARYRLKAWTTTCDTIYSNYALLTVEGPLKITDQPVSVTECSGDGTSFSVEVWNSGGGQLSYQWQVSANQGATWQKVDNNSKYNGAKTANLSISTVAGMNGNCYRVNIQTSKCAAITSNTVCLTVEGPIKFTKHPESIIQCSADTVKFTSKAIIEAGNAGVISYHWQLSQDGLNWDSISSSNPLYFGVHDTTLILTDVAGLNGWQYRLTATTGKCKEVHSNPAILTVEGPLNITDQPDDITTCDDKEVFFAAIFENEGQGLIQYQWQVLPEGSNIWQNMNNGTTPDGHIINGTKSDTLSIAPVTGLDGYKYRLLGWTGTCDTLITNPATLYVEGPLEFETQPLDTILCSAGEVHFTVKVLNTSGIGTVSYQWRVSANGGVTWADVVDGGVNNISGAKTDSLNIGNITDLYNRKYRCEVKTGSCDPEFSQLATLFVEGPITIDEQPVDASVCSNIGHIFESTVSNPGAGVLKFQWWVKPSGGSWAILSNGPITGVSDNNGSYQGVKTMDLSISLVHGLNGYQYRLEIKTDNCSKISDSVQLTVLDACMTGACDNDLDGLNNDDDPDDDNDLLSDFWEEWMATYNTIVVPDTTDFVGFAGTGPWEYTNSDGVTQLFYDRCKADTDGNGIIDGLEDPDGDLLTNHEETNFDGIFDGNPLDPCHPVLGPTCVGVNLAIKVYLQGATIGSNVSNAGDTLMRDDLRIKNLIPEKEPYTDIENSSGNIKPFKHKGDGGHEEMEDPATTLAVTGEDAIVDWVFVELRSSTKLDSVISTRAALLQRDGDVVDTNGVSNVKFTIAPAGPYYVAVRHRNHLGVMTAEALDLSPIQTFVDFTDSTFLTNGSNAQVKLKLGGGIVKMAMWAGDLNSDGRTIYQGPSNDPQSLFLKVLNNPNNTLKVANYIMSGYLREDVNLDGRAIYQGPGNDRAILLLQTTLKFPENEDNLANYVIFQQLP